MRPLRLILLVGCAMGCTLAACSSARTLESAEINPLTKGWLLLTEPISTPEVALLGTAYSPEDGDRFAGCYDFDATEVSSSFDTVILKKEKSGSAAGFFKVLKTLGIDADASRIAEASIQLDSVKIAQVSSVAPQPVECAAVRPDGMPQFPAIIALVGVKKFAFSAQDAQQVNVTGDFAQETEDAHVEFDLAKSESATFSFGNHRWIGARFVGFNKLPDGEEQVFSLPLGKLEQVEISGRRKVEVKVVKHPNGFEIRRRRVSRAPGSRLTRQVEENEAFLFDRPRRSRVLGHHLMGRLRSAGADSVELTLWSQGFERISFVGEDARSSLMAWIDN